MWPFNGAVRRSSAGLRTARLAVSGLSRSPIFSICRAYSVWPSTELELKEKSAQKDQPGKLIANELQHTKNSINTPSASKISQRNNQERWTIEELERLISVRNNCKTWYARLSFSSFSQDLTVSHRFEVHKMFPERAPVVIKAAYHRYKGNKSAHVDPSLDKKRWTADETNEMLELLKQSVSTLEVARRLKRSAGSVRNKINRLRGSSREKVDWTDAEDAVLLAERSKRVRGSNKRTAAILPNRTTSAAQSRWLNNLRWRPQEAGGQNSNDGKKS